MAHNRNENKHNTDHQAHHKRQSMLKRRLSKEFRLPAIRSVAPQRYMGVGLCVVLLIVLAAALVVPRTVRIRMTIYSLPSQAVILVNGTRVGTTPVDVVLTRGTHTIEAQKDGYALYRADISLPRAVSNSSYNVEKKTVALYLEIEDTVDNIELTGDRDSAISLTSRAQHWYNSIYEWSLTGTTVAGYHRPAVIQHAANALATSGEFLDAWRIVESAVYDLTDATGLADWIAATSTATSSIPHPTSIAASLQLSQHLLLSDINSADYIEQLLKQSSVYQSNADTITQQLSVVRGSGWYNDLNEALVYQNALIKQQQLSATAIPIDVTINTDNGGVQLGTFVEYLIEPPTSEHDASMATTILMAQQPATIQNVITYLNDTPQTNSPTDAYQHYVGIVDSVVSQQLQQGNIIGDAIALGLSLPDIEQYLAWIAQQLPPSLQDYQVRLPYSHEISLIAVTSSAPLSVTPTIWEWSETTYHARTQHSPIVSHRVLPITSQYEARSIYSIQESEVITGALPIDAQSPVTGFRIVLEKP